MRSRLALAVVTMVVAVSSVGCASGPKYDTMVDSIPSIPAGQGRIFFYRDGSPFGSAVQAPIVLNDMVVGKSVPGGFLFVDRPPGSCEVSCSTEAEKTLTFTLAAGQRRYVRTRVSMGVFVGQINPVLEDEEVAMKTLAKSSYIGEILATEE